MKVLRWMTMNGLFAIAVWFGLFEGVYGASNIAYFIAWVSFLASLVLLSEEGQELLAKNASVPASLDCAFDMAITGAFLWHGAVATAFVYWLHMILVQGARARQKS